MVPFQPPRIYPHGPTEYFPRGFTIGNIRGTDRAPRTGDGIARGARAPRERGGGEPGEHPELAAEDVRAAGEDDRGEDLGDKRFRIAVSDKETPNMLK